MGEKNAKHSRKGTPIHAALKNTVLVVGSVLRMRIMWRAPHLQSPAPLSNEEDTKRPHRVFCVLGDVGGKESPLWPRQTSLRGGEGVW